MEAIGYGIIIGVLIGLGIFAGACLILKVQKTPDWQPFSFLTDKSEEEKIMTAGKVKPANYDEPPQTAEEYHQNYKRDGFAEELPASAPRE